MFRVYGSGGVWVQVSGFRVWGLGLRVRGVESRVEDLGFRGWGLFLGCGV